jgi:hypothetical protein
MMRQLQALPPDARKRQMFGQLSQVSEGYKLGF